MSAVNTMNYRGYTARLSFDPRDRIFVGRVVGIEESITFHGESVSELTSGFQSAVEAYLEECRQEGREPAKPASGRLMLRVGPDVHLAALTAAAAAGMSLNEWAGRALEVAAASSREDDLFGEPVVAEISRGVFKQVDANVAQYAETLLDFYRGAPTSAPTAPGSWRELLGGNATEVTFYGWGERGPSTQSSIDLLAFIDAMTIAASHSSAWDRLASKLINTVKLTDSTASMLRSFEAVLEANRSVRNAAFHMLEEGAPKAVPKR